MPLINQLRNDSDNVSGMNLGGRLDVVFARILKAIKRQVKSNILAFLVVIYL
jgi:hypothetical protein